MRFLLLLILIVTAIRPMPVMAAMPAEAHAMMMESEAGHCEEQDVPATSQHDHCGECCLSVMPPIEFGNGRTAAIGTADHTSLSLTTLRGRSTVADPPPPRS